MPGPRIRRGGPNRQSGLEAALPGDVHDLVGLRDIGDRLAANRPELPEADGD